MAITKAVYTQSKIVVICFSGAAASLITARYFPYVCNYLLQ
jgi:hypothetical protein